MAIVGKTYICPFCMNEFVAVKKKEYTCGAQRCQIRWKHMKDKGTELQNPPPPEFSPLPLKISRAAGHALAQRQGVWTSDLTLDQKSDAARAEGKSYGKWVAEQQEKYEKENGIGMYAKKWR